ncbi:helix-turn-helix domain-containing protein [Dokdonia sp. MED134]|jgi:AraC-like DNA-binding protein|uniref:Transcriptional regulator n=1 Tax=uncultured Dokdonia sp. TaxID=575653 RepID=F4MNL8_9FLAO|nr:helix-turn-helix domain-containing protein [Dokdonia sp. MED134]AOE06604.1 transcriptional regulator, AraC family [uncultured bacterium]EAQ38582.1 transcription regulator, AraC family [Dokdonia sp. MED134]CBL88330.1 transcriptional regulator [uncultured Dokdonia sp.]
MIFEPHIAEVKKHIDHYWIVKDAALLSMGSPTMYAYPGITPDMIIVLDGHYTMSYMGKTYTSNRSKLYSFIHKEVVVDLSHLKSCIIIKFKSRGLSSLKPFLDLKTEAIMKDSVAFADDVFGMDVELLKIHLLTLSPSEIASELDQWFAERYKKEREGFVVAMAQEVSASCDIQTIIKATNYSYSTLERHFKRDTGLTPKKFQSLQRYKKAIRELYVTRNSDWQHYVVKYGYYDQSHFIKEIKRYTNHTPSQLLKTPSFIEVRPNYF